jgi:hypothetical protein
VKAGPPPPDYLRSHAGARRPPHPPHPLGPRVVPDPRRLRGWFRCWTICSTARGRAGFRSFLSTGRRCCWRIISGSGRSSSRPSPWCGPAGPGGAVVRARGRADPRVNRWCAISCRHRRCRRPGGGQAIAGCLGHRRCSRAATEFGIRLPWWRGIGESGGAGSLPLARSDGRQIVVYHPARGHEVGAASPRDGKARARPAGRRRMSR